MRAALTLFIRIKMSHARIAKINAEEHATMLNGAWLEGYASATCNPDKGENP